MAIKMRDAEYNLMRRLEDRVAQNGPEVTRQNQRASDIESAAQFLRKVWEAQKSSVVWEGEDEPSEEDAIQYPTEQARDICERLVGEWEQLYLKKNEGYGKVDSLGPKGVFPEINRKVGKLRRTLWDGQPDAPGSEPQREVMLDLIGHLFIALHLLDTEGDPRDAGAYLFIDPGGVVGRTATVSWSSPGPGMLTQLTGGIRLHEVHDSFIAGERVAPLPEHDGGDFHNMFQCSHPTCQKDAADAAANDEPSASCDCEEYVCSGECCGVGNCSCSAAEPTDEELMADGEAAREMHGGFEGLPSEIQDILRSVADGETFKANQIPMEKWAALREFVPGQDGF